MAEIEWNGFKAIEFEFVGRLAILVFPKARGLTNKWLLKTEYWDAFPATEIELLNQGYHLAYIKNNNRWGIDEDLDAKAQFAKYLTEKYQLSSQCVPVGMSCGGLIAIKFAAKYPKLVSCLYLDAPVLNFMSCPCGFGIAKPLDNGNGLNEILNALKLKNISELLCYQEQPMNKIPLLVNNKIPLIMVAGDSDYTVPYCENGIMVEKAYRNTGIDFQVYIKPECDHHPHGLDNPKPVVDFIFKH